MANYKIYNCFGDEIDNIFQWDKNRVINITGIDTWDGASVFFDFTNRKRGLRYSVVPDEYEGTFRAVIPNELLQFDDPIVIYFYQTTDSNENITIGEVKITITPRTIPSEYLYEATEKIVRIADGLILENNQIFLSYGGRKFGDGASIGSGGSVGIEVARPQINSLTAIVCAGTFHNLEEEGIS